MMFNTWQHFINNCFVPNQVEVQPLSWGEGPCARVALFPASAADNCCLCALYTSKLHLPVSLKMLNCVTLAPPLKVAGKAGEVLLGPM